MDSNPPPIQASPISSIPSSRKLPIKRKNPNSNSTFTLTPHDSTTNTPPFKRIWTEPDEIRLLQGLLHCSSQGLSFPRDLGIFYAQFSHAMSMSQPYSKSQFSEKLRRLRKKFRVISSRLDKGLDYSQLSLQDQALFDLSKQLWDPDVAGINSNCKPINNNIDRINNNDNNDNDGDDDNDNDNDDSNKFSMPSSLTAVLALPSVVKKPGGKMSKVGGGLKCGDELGGEVKLVEKEVRVNKDDGGDLRSGIVRFVTAAVADVVDRSLKEMRMLIDVERVKSLEREMSFERRWRDQRAAEFDMFAKRLKLIAERSSMVGK
ncbi:uncharacterized protein LOC143588920 [Bidens hawaiensis]|uniref:uncharacterized protein LOC143588920 n=1 Tax=Bidens hawaiensis TaxID=980011 RepID=UPI004049E236